MRRTAFVGLLLVALAACSRRSPLVADTDETALATDAGGYFAFRIEAIKQATDGTLSMAAWHLREGVGVDLVTDAEAIGIDRERLLILSWGIVDADALSQILAAPDPPGPAVPFSVRFQYVVPVVDLARTEAALTARLSRRCAGPEANTPAWTHFLEALPNDRERQAAAAAGATYVCWWDKTAVVARRDVRRRALRLSVAFGDGDIVTAAASRLAPARALAARLQREGFFSARELASFVTPTNNVRALSALSLVKARLRLNDAHHVDDRRAQWKEIVAHMGALGRLVDSPPRLFTDALAVDRLHSWGLTEAGRTFFSSLAVPADADLKQLLKAIGQNFQPGGDFAAGNQLRDSVDEAGEWAPYLLVYLWPHAVAFGLAQPDKRSPLDGHFAPPDARFSLDRDQGRLLLRGR